MNTDLPKMIETYQRAHDQRDTETALATFSADATVVDDGSYVVSNHLSGNFPGGEADLRYRFRLEHGLILRLEIAP